ncbi:MAG: GH116 family glycosyl hydrolase [Phycisphaerae bacterium]
MPTLSSSITHCGGIPLGGLGTGSVEIWPDGYFHQWQIFNLGRWAAYQPDKPVAPEPKMDIGGLTFYLRTREGGGEPLTRRLGMRTDQHNLYSFAWLKSVEQIDFTGAYPMAALEYIDDDLPVAVEAAMFSPMIPHDARTSGTPGFSAVFTLTNLTDEPVDVSLMGLLNNPVAAGLDDRRLTNTISRDHGATFLTMATASREKFQTVGSLSLGVSGGDASWLAGEYESYIGGIFVSHWSAGQTPYGMAHESLFHEFRRDGRLPSLGGGNSPSGLLTLSAEEIAALPPRQQKALLEEILQQPFAHYLWRRVKEVEPAILRGREGVSLFLNQARVRLDHLAGRDRKGGNWGTGALCSTLTLAPHERRQVRFVLGWHFPYHYSARGPVLGHAYENWFKDAGEVSRFLMANAPDHQRQVEQFTHALMDTTLPDEMPQAWSAQLSTLAKCTWWTKDDKFAVWEGLGCCGFHTTDITYQGSFSILALFPELQQRQMKMGAKFQRADGRVHHFFVPDLSAVDGGFDRVDMNQQFVLLACRDYLWTGDRAYIRSLWPHIVAAMNNTAALDADGDGLPDHDTCRNTYDAWNFAGTPSYIASLWLGALLAGARIAEDLGHARQGAAWRRLLKKASASFDKKLWNGEYYSLWVDGRDRDECCMTDQIDGEWFTGLIGLGSCLPRQRITAALEAIVRHNFNSEDGLLNATYPSGRKKRLCTYRNLQAAAPWTGIEYAMASMMLDFGMPGPGTAVVRNIHDRYLRAGRFWNHVECGDHYYRAMSSWAVLLGATGFKIDVPRQSVTFAPALADDQCRAPWVSSTGWGNFSQGPSEFTLRCHCGRLSFKLLNLHLQGKVATVRLNGRKIPATISLRRGEAQITLARAAALTEGDVLTVQ